MKVNEIDFKKTTRGFFYSFISGSLSIFGLGNPLNNLYIENESEEDARNIFSDWNNIGNDMRKSYEKYKSEHLQ